MRRHAQLGLVLSFAMTILSACESETSLSLSLADTATAMLTVDIQFDGNVDLGPMEIWLDNDELGRSGWTFSDFSSGHEGSSLERLGEGRVRVLIPLVEGNFPANVGAPSNGVVEVVVRSDAEVLATASIDASAILNDSRSADFISVGVSGGNLLLEMQLNGPESDDFSVTLSSSAFIDRPSMVLSWDDLGPHVRSGPSTAEVPRGEVVVISYPLMAHLENTVTGSPRGQAMIRWAGRERASVRLPIFEFYQTDMEQFQQDTINRINRIQP